jgi:hypothetical protein
MAFALRLTKRIVAKKGSVPPLLRKRTAVKETNAQKKLTARKVVALNPKADHAKKNYHAVASVLGATAWLCAIHSSQLADHGTDLCIV